MGANCVNMLYMVCDMMLMPAFVYTLYRNATTMQPLSGST